MGEKLRLILFFLCLNKIAPAFTPLERKARPLGGVKKCYIARPVRNQMTFNHYGFTNSVISNGPRVGFKAPPKLSNGVYSSLDLSVDGRFFLGRMGPIGSGPCIIRRKMGNSSSGFQLFSCSGVRRFLTLIRYSTAFSSNLDCISLISEYLERMDSIFTVGFVRISRSSSRFEKS